jgi:UDP-N-acetylmuramoyl-tripeptide--D-alanyl-D-alanine ligase
MKVREIVGAAGGKLVSGAQDLDVAPSRFSTDSRTIKKGDLFVAIEGPNFDGNDFLDDAFRKGAIGAIVSRSARDAFRRDKRPGREKRPDHERRVIIRVKDTTRAYGAIAHYHRMQFRIPLIAVTGSNGKTTTKDMIWHILSGRYNVLKNEGTRNNHIGLPQTLLALKEATDIAVVELGMNHMGELAYLGTIAEPSIAVLTNIGPSHLEHLGSLGNVFKAKTELLRSLPAGAVAVLNGDDELLSRYRTTRLKAVTFGFGRNHDFRASHVKLVGRRWAFLVNGRHPFELNMLGRHNIYNALAAIAVSAHFVRDFSYMRERLLTFKADEMRLRIKRLSGVEFMNDAYNSNPLSMKCALSALLDYGTKGRRFVVSGDMLELGRAAKEYHARTGELIAKSKVDFLFTVGRLSQQTARAALRAGMKEENVKRCMTHEDAALLLKRMARPRDVVLVKGSRAMQMEKVIERFEHLLRRA